MLLKISSRLRLTHQQCPRVFKKRKRGTKDCMLQGFHRLLGGGSSVRTLCSATSTPARIHEVTPRDGKQVWSIIRTLQYYGTFIPTTSFQASSNAHLYIHYDSDIPIQDFKTNTKSWIWTRNLTWCKSLWLQTQPRLNLPALYVELYVAYSLLSLFLSFF